MAETTTLNQSIETAVTELNKDTASGDKGAENKEGQEKQEKEVADASAGDTEDKHDNTEAKPGKYGLSELEEEQARQLFAALKNPEQAPTVLDFLAKQGGYTKVETKADVKEAKKDIVGQLKEALGPDMDYLAEKLGPVIDKYLGEKLEENTKDIRQKVEATEEAKHREEATAAMGKLAKDNFNADEIPDNVAQEMNRLMDNFPPPNVKGKGVMPTGEYLEYIYHMAAGKLGIQPTNKQQEDRRSRNRNDAPSRLASGASAKGVSPSGDAGKFTTLDAAVRAAVEAAQEK